MKDSERPDKTRKLLESGLLSTGAVLLAVFVVAKSWSGLQSDSGIEAFEQARAAIASTAMAEPGPIAAGQATHSLAIPDTSLWSEKRIREHQASLQVPADAPQAILDIGHLGIRVPVYNGADEAMPETFTRLKRTLKDKKRSVEYVDDEATTADFVVIVGGKTKALKP